MELDTKTVNSFANVPYLCLSCIPTGGRQLVVNKKVKASKPSITSETVIIEAADVSGGVAPRTTSTTTTTTSNAEAPTSAFTVDNVATQPIRFKITALFHGDNYRSDRDRLLNAFDKAKISELKCEYGTYNVYCEKWGASYSSTILNEDTVTFECIEAAETDNTRDVLDLSVGSNVTKVRSFIDTAVGALAEYSKYDPSVIKAKVSATIAANAQFLTFAISKGKTAADFVGNTYEDSLALATEITEQATEYVDDMAPLLVDVNDFADFISTSFTSRDDVYESLFEMSKSIGDKQTTNIEGSKDRLNEIFTDSIFRIGTINKAVEQLDFLSFASVLDVERVRGDIFDQLDSIQLDMADFKGFGLVYQSLTELRASVAEVLSGKLGALPNLTTITVRESIPADVLAYNLYQDISRAQEIIDRNNIDNGLFVSGEISVLEN